MNKSNDITQRRIVRQMQDYIEFHIKDPLTLKQLTKAANVSPSYGTKLFKEYTGQTPYQYIKHYRLTEAAKILRDQESKVLDVALDFVFDSHEGFTRAFSKTFGMSPKKYSKQKPPINWMSVNPISVKEKEETNMNPFIFTQVIERPKRKLLVLRGKTATEYFAYCSEVGCDVWGILTSVKEALYEPAGFWLPDHMIPEGTSQYVQGVEVPIDYNNAIPEGFELIDMPESLIMIFQGPTYDDNYFETNVREAMKAIKSFNPEMYGYAYDKSMPRFQLEPQGERGYIEGWPVNKI